MAEGLVSMVAKWFRGLRSDSPDIPMTGSEAGKFHKYLPQEVSGTPQTDHGNTRVLVLVNEASWNCSRSRVLETCWALPSPSSRLPAPT